MAGYIGSKASVVSSGAERKKVFNITGATTSLTGCNYTVGKVQVFQNGVRLLDGTDYTATDGTTVTLTVAAQSGDNVVVLSFASYQVALSGIDDQSNATAITIDSNENVLVGMTSSSGTSAGFRVIPNDFMSFTTTSSDAGDRALLLNRQSSDGTLLEFKKANSAVGSIGTNGSTLYIGSTEGADAHIGFGNQIIRPVTSSGASRDNAVDLGYNGMRFRDAYLSGGIYLGGVGSANKLDDYEEGTWTITDGSGGGITFGFTHNRYTKIGRLVMAHVRLQFPTTSNTSLARVNLPFTADANSNSSATGGVVTEQNYDSSICLTACINDANRVLFRNNGVTSLTNAQLSGKLLRFTVTYNAT